MLTNNNKSIVVAKPCLVLWGRCNPVALDVRWVNTLRTSARKYGSLAAARLHKDERTTKRPITTRRSKGKQPCAVFNKGTMVRAPTRPVSASLLLSEFSQLDFTFSLSSFVFSTSNKHICAAFKHMPILAPPTKSMCCVLAQWSSAVSSTENTLCICQYIFVHISKFSKFASNNADQTDTILVKCLLLLF